jgi:iron(III) transport system permease protein
MTILLFALPSTVIGIGLISLWNQPLTNFIYATPAIIILGYLAQYTALTSRITVATLVQIPPSMEEAAQVAGAWWLRRIIWIVAPLAKRGLIAGWLVGYIFCLRDTGISMMVYPPGHDTFPVRIFTLMANSPAELIAALCVIMIGATLLPLGLLGLAFRARKPVL